MLSERSLKVRWDAVRTVAAKVGVKVEVNFAATMMGIVMLGAGCSDSATTAKSNSVQTDRATPIFGSDAGWEDTSVPELLTDTQACARYQRAVCERRNECGLASDDCAKAIANCPDSMFSPGSTRQKESTWDCAFQMRQRSCHDVYYGVNPACVTPGTRKSGDNCVSAAQCASLACTSSGTNCGVCVERVGKDKDCTDKTKVTCDRGLTCSPNSNVCVDLPEKTFVDVTASGIPIGSQCDLTHLCIDDAYCKVDASGIDLCTAQVPIGATCTTNAACVKGSYCAQEDGQCTKLPEANVRCGNDVETGNALYCTDGNYCDQRAGYMCKPLPTDHRPCAETLFSGEPNVCAPSAACDSSVDPPICVGLAAAGEDCANDSGCQTGLKCACRDVNCGQKLCSFIRDIGESCAKPGEFCNAVSTCTDGLCKANPTQNLFAVCGG
ncbi:MAG TPA: hypothetical protein VIV60_24430 [Polyangiaceae bacterium]